METLARDVKLVIGMVGLPARGKTYVSRKITRYLNWLGFKCGVFNIGEYRRLICGTKECTANFFDPANDEAVKARNECANVCLEDLIKFLKEGGDVAIYDGTNTSIERRNMVKDTLNEKFGGDHTLMWIESICDDDNIIENNIRMTKLSSPDYRDVDSEIATSDFRQRIEEYRKKYEELTKEGDGEDASFIKLYDVGSQVVMNNITGYIESKIVSFLMNLHITPRPIYFTRHGQSLFNIEDRVGGDPELSERGKKYSVCLSKFFEEEAERGRVNGRTKILTSTLKRAVTTANSITFGPQPVYLKSLDELNAGTCDGLSYLDIANQFPIEIKERKNDKLNYRYPRGESYLDVIQRIEPIIFEIERSKEPVIVVAHQAVIRCLYAYFSRHDIVEIPFISIPLHTVIKLIPGTYYAHETNYKIDVDTGNVQEVNVAGYSLIEDYRSVKA